MDQKTFAKQARYRLGNQLLGFGLDPLHLSALLSDTKAYTHLVLFLVSLRPERKQVIKKRMGSGAGTSFLKVLLKNCDVLAWPVVSLVYPLYASIRAIESKSPVDDQQWLTYWILYSMISLFELTFAKIIEWIPFWPYAKLILTCWLVIPYFSGAAYVYEHYVRPLFINPQTINVWYVPRKKDIFSKPDDVLSAAEKYIEENGTEAFEKLIHRADKSRTNMGQKIFQDYTY